MDSDFFWRRYSPKELDGYSEDTLKGITDDLRCKIKDALWELAELEEENACLDVQASARMVVIDQLLDLHTERTRDLDTYFRGVQMSVKGIRHKKRSPSIQQPRGKFVTPSDKGEETPSENSLSKPEQTIKTS
ncbi:uncharacterized protein LOC111263982 [Varroa jacobsoni]|uniref:Uncharacterized protein n=1 Tax=Varroa destructor TaxID=109461 RepID=A0A7M7JNZ7_VARDE|nr:uncharacterized protein LOC111247708 [Varroa destructor]XP_022695270.1 uncharacterized protein LOC111263982 [Varroa jacobsoni]XP_022695271.1 uncharacterized protein LOC111263982 [Varroa jacobsoni]XP_022695272.1 uncharacterized protein LOC111263982 [Varroa jacobsoni]XP_022695273.1 uncharacterized protein LOC111263982 [Varroa jacobsoni]XP_022695274.1 uncharacterized protein LOC111263982 [Varroa jacobsoni]